MENNIVAMNRPMFMSIKDAVKVTGLSEYYIRKNLKAGKIPHIRSDGKIFVNMVQLSAALENMTENSIIKLQRR